VSQSARILAVLADGNPHLVSEIHARAGYSRLNSRVAELRTRGYVIESFHVGGKTGSEGYGYSLVSSPLPGGTVRSSPPLRRGSLTEPDAASTPSEVSSGQLSLLVAA
jgi:hypothetical protein